MLKHSLEHPSNNHPNLLSTASPSIEPSSTRVSDVLPLILKRQTSTSTLYDNLSSTSRRNLSLSGNGISYYVADEKKCDISESAPAKLITKAYKQFLAENEQIDLHRNLSSLSGTGSSWKNGRIDAPVFDIYEHSNKVAKRLTSEFLQSNSKSNQPMPKNRTLEFLPSYMKSDSLISTSNAHNFASAKSITLNAQMNGCPLDSQFIDSVSKQLQDNNSLAKSGIRSKNTMSVLCTPTEPICQSNTSTTSRVGYKESINEKFRLAKQLVSQHQTNLTKNSHLVKKPDTKAKQTHNLRAYTNFSQYQKPTSLLSKPASLLKESPRMIESKLETGKLNVQNRIQKGQSSITQESILKNYSKVINPVKTYAPLSKMTSQLRPVISRMENENKMRNELANSKQHYSIHQNLDFPPSNTQQTFNVEISEKIVKLEEFVQKFIDSIDKDVREYQEIIPKIKSLVKNRREEMIKSLRCSAVTPEAFLEQSMREDAVLENEIRQLVSQLSSKRNSLRSETPLEDPSHLTTNNHKVILNPESSKNQFNNTDIRLAPSVQPSDTLLPHNRMEMVVNIYENRGSNLHSANTQKTDTCAPQRSVIYTKLTGKLDETLQQKAHVQAEIDSEVRKCVPSQAERLQDLKEQMKRFRIREIDLVQKIQEEERRLKKKEFTAKMKTDSMRIFIPEIDCEAESKTISSVNTPRYAV